MPPTRYEKVWHRAHFCCEYCQLAQIYDPRPFHVDHIRPRKHGGKTSVENLCLSCSACNLFKGSDIAGWSPDTGRLCPLFNPRTQAWSDHFEWEGGTLVGLTEIGKTTASVLRINDPLRLKHRELLIQRSVFPPKHRAAPGGSN